MKTEFIKVTSNDIDKIKRAGEIIRNGGLVAFPTETVYGLGGNALDAEAANKIYSAKGRPSDNPLIVHVSDPSDAEKFAYTNEDYYKLAKAFMPGPLTVILPKKDIIPDSVTGGLDSVAIRCPINPIAKLLIELSGVPIAAPSANLSGSPSPTNANHVLCDLNGRIDMILDGGESSIGLESTVVKLTENGCIILRPGDVIPRELSTVLNNVMVSDAVLNPNAAGDKPLSPGMKYKHYAPKSNLILLDCEKQKFIDYINTNKENIAVLAYSEEISLLNNKTVIDIGSEFSPKEQMHRLFRILRETDDLNCDTIYAHLPPSNDEFLALSNRIIRAAGCNIIKL